MLTEQTVMTALSRVMEPELHRDLVSLNMIKDLVIKGKDLTFSVELTTPACPLKDVMEKDIRAALAAIGAGTVTLNWTSNVAANAGMRGAVQTPIKNIVAVASGKGGVGKSTVSANLAIALAQTGARVGLLDNDVYGPNIPLMFGLPSAQLQADGRAMPSVRQVEGKLIPIDRFGVKVFSIGFIYPAEMPLVWRGPMLHSAIRQFLSDVDWGDLDYLVIDMPPGTGDSQLSLAQATQGAMGIIVTTPQLVSMSDALKGLAAFEQLKIPVIGVIENMGPSIDPKTGTKTALFGEGGGERLAAMKHVPFLGSVPLDGMIRVGGDSGRPIVVADPAAPAAQRFAELARAVAARVSVLNFNTAAPTISVVE
ncbi:MAG: Mrp/NBP35 family ATP-binding protein [Thermoflexales bacterium]|nr:Mrp/NBP35 family ATP-binding protein [Thermoflexales bacterium]